MKKPSRDELLVIHKAQAVEVAALEQKLRTAKALLFAVEETLVEEYGWEPPLDDPC